MKKSLVALAVLAASGAAMAQSSVTLYGIADIWLGSVKNETAGTSVRQTKLDSGGVSTSRWGIKGSEDLGGGLSANFKLEQGFAMDTGAGGASTGQGTGAQAFDRQAYVGFSGGFGEVQFGKVWSAYDDVSGASNAMFDAGGLAPMYQVFKSTNYIDRPINGFRYSSPTFGGLSGAVSYSLDEGVATATSITALSFSYGAGPLAVQLGYQDEDLNNTSVDTKYLRLGGTYDFGMAVAKLTYGKATDIGNVNGDDATEYQLGLDVPVGSAVVLSASYAKSKDDKNAGFEQSRKGFGLGATYTLSKRTFLYGGYESDKATNNAAADSKHSVFAVGVQHKF
jgi:predicted porin